MRVTIFSGFLLLVAAVAAPVAAQPPEGEGDRLEGPRRFDPAQFFERLDEDGDGALSLEEAPERMKERFETIDADGDGLVTLEEFQAARPPRGEGEGRPPRGEGGEGEGRPPRGDGEGRPPRGDGEGRPPRGEGGEGRPPRGEGGEGRPPRDGGQFAERVFERLDANEDGILTLDEVPEQFQEGFQAILESADDDGDEGVTLEQYKAAMEAHFAERRAARGEGEGDRPGPPRDGDRPHGPRGEGDRSPGEGRPPRGEGDRPPGARPHGPSPERVMAHLLERADADGDGQLSREEVLAQMGEHFDRVDTNDDGIVDQDELAAAMEHHRRPGPPPGDGPPPEGE